jgi:hypothetical protein
MWGRSGWAARGGSQDLPFFLYVPMKGLLDADGTIHFEPHYFAGYDKDGAPRWSTNNADAFPIYGGDATVSEDGGVPHLVFPHPEFDLVNQMGMSFVESLGKWVMLYGGDLPRFLRYDADTNQEVPDVHPQPSPGAVYLRSATHPWGRARRDGLASEDWTDAEAVLTREQAAPFLGCDEAGTEPKGCTDEHDPHRPLQMLLEVDSKTEISASDAPEITKACLDGDATQTLTYALSGDASGHLYGANIIDPWTEDVTASTKDLAKGERAVRLFWNVSTWNPYGVALIQTELRGHPVH